MILTGIFLAIATFIGMAIIFTQLPESIKKAFCINKWLRLFADLGGTVLSYILLASISSSLIAAIACALNGILISLGLRIYGEKYNVLSRHG